MSIKTKVRKDKYKKLRKPHKYKWHGVDRHYVCPDHDREIRLTDKQYAGEKPVKCDGHEFTNDFRQIDRLMLTG